MSTNTQHSPRYDLPLDDHSARALMAWSTGFAVFVATIALAGFLFFSHWAQSWTQGVSSTLTVEIFPPPSKSAAPDGEKNPAERQAEAVAEKLSGLSGIAEAAVLPRDRTEALLSPWLDEKDGLAALAQALPLPALIDVRLNPEDPAALPDIERAIADVLAISGADTDTSADTKAFRIENHAGRLAGLKRLLRVTEAGLLALAVLILLASSAVVAASSRSRLQLLKNDIGLLHLMGATDAYIARQFQRHTTRSTIRGAFAGMTAALLTLAAAVIATGRMDSGLSPLSQASLHLVPGQWHWIALAFLPLLLGLLISGLVARFSVLQALRQLP